MSRHQDQLELLTTAKTTIDALFSEYDAARGNDEVIQVSRVPIKSCLENIRSAFEYMAMDIYESYSKKKTKIYFPYGENEKSFKGSVDKNLPGLATQAPNLFKLVESVQPHYCGDKWLVEFCKTTNFNKHNRLSSQVRTNADRSVVQIPGLFHFEGINSVTMENVTLNGQPVIKGKLVINNERPFKDMREEIYPQFGLSRTFDWVELKLDNVDYDIHKLLLRAHSEASRLADEVARQIG